MSEIPEAVSLDKPCPLAQEEAARIASAARERKITAKSIGGIAIYFQCPSAALPPLQREYKDIDLVAARSSVGPLTQLLVEMGHAPDKRFNAIQGRERLFFWDEENSRQLDVFVDAFEMCHKFDLKKRLMVDPASASLPLADLLLTKMQVVEMNLKDMQDTAALLQDHPFTEDEQGINIAYITALTRNDWGLQHTLEGTIAKIREGSTLVSLKAQQPAHDLAQQLDQLERAMHEAPKSTGWKIRSKVGERVTWYELPEEART